MPVRTLTPDAVVVPLQYAVAWKSRRVPGIGDPAAFEVIAWRAA
jgi:hypothetical protein